MPDWRTDESAPLAKRPRLSESGGSTSRPSTSSGAQFSPPSHSEEVREEARRRFKKYCTDLVVRAVTTYNKSGKLEKDDFKKICRKLSHQILEKEDRNDFVIGTQTETKIKKFVDGYFASLPAFQNHPRVLKLKKR